MFKKLDVLFRNELVRILDSVGSDKMLLEDVRRKFDNDSEFGIEYSKRTFWKVNSFADRFEIWCKRSGMMHKELINTYNRRYIVRK